MSCTRSLKTSKLLWKFYRNIRTDGENITSTAQVLHSELFTAHCDCVPDTLHARKKQQVKVPFLEKKETSEL